MIGYYTDNSVSQAVMQTFFDAGVKTLHISEFYKHKGEPSIFYGILRGSGIAMRWCKAQGIDFWYVDNGYFGAEYLSRDTGAKKMSGKYRIVKNDMIEPYDGEPDISLSFNPYNRVLILPPSPYTAFMYDTTPQDWIVEWIAKCTEHHCLYDIREKDCELPLGEQLNDYDIIIAFNSMAAVKAIEMGKCVYTTQGIVRNDDLFGIEMPYYAMDQLRSFYKDKQFTLDDIKGGKRVWSKS